MNEPTLRRSRIPHWGWLLAGTVLIVVTFVGIRFVVPIYRQYQTIADLRSGGVDVNSQHIPGWLPDWMGKEFELILGSGVGVYVYDKTFSDGDLVRLERLKKKLQILRLEETQITDHGLNQIAGMKNLRLLNLIGTPITDDGLIELTGLTNLHELWLKDTQVTPAAIATFKATLPGCTIHGP